MLEYDVWPSRASPSRPGRRFRPARHPTRRPCGPDSPGASHSPAPTCLSTARNGGATSSPRWTTRWPGRGCGEMWAGRGLEEAPLEQQVGVGLALLGLAAVPIWLWLRGDRRRLPVAAPPCWRSSAWPLLQPLPERRIGPFTLCAPRRCLYEVAPMFPGVRALRYGGGRPRDRCWRGRALSVYGIGQRPPAGAGALLLALAALEYAPFPPGDGATCCPLAPIAGLAGTAGSLAVCSTAEAPARAHSDRFARRG
jgi:hypothetical protein